MVNHIDWIEIRTKDIEKTANFYEDIFGWKIVQKLDIDGRSYWIFDQGDIPREENIRRGAFCFKPNEPPRTIFYILVEDIDETLQNVKNLGGRIIEKKTQIRPQRFCAYITDLNDNMIGLWEEK